MSVPFAYVGVIIIWSTTPLAVQWSNDSLTPIAAVTLRMALAWVFTLLLCVVMKIRLDGLLANWRAYAVASIGMFPNMPLVNLAAEYIPSGLIALIFGTSPFTVALLSRYVLKEHYLTGKHLAAMLIAVMGLWMIFREHLTIDQGAIIGIALMFLSVLLFSISTVLVKHYDANVHPLKQIYGSLLYALPGLFISWYIFDGQMPESFSDKTIGSILYLSIIGSVLGFMAYFYLLRHLPPAAVSVITLITPLIAVWLGVWANNEPMSWSICIGSVLVVGALLMFSGVFSGQSFRQLKEVLHFRRSKNVVLVEPDAKDLL